MITSRRSGLSRFKVGAHAMQGVADPSTVNINFSADTSCASRICAVLEEQAVMCLKDKNASCKFSIPASMGAGSMASYVYMSEMTSNTSSSCSTPLFVLPTTQGVVAGDLVEFSLPSGILDPLGLHDKPVAICWTRKAVSSGSSVPAANSSFLGNIITVDPDTTANILYAGLLPKIRIKAIGLFGNQASLEGLPQALQTLYLKDKSMCSSTRSTVTIPLALTGLAFSDGKGGFACPKDHRLGGRR